MVVNGWTLMVHELFAVQYAELVAAVEKERARDPGEYLHSQAAKRLKAVSDLVRVKVPANPLNPDYRQGHTLGDGHTHWFRAKFGNGRYRLFFRFSSATKVIIFVWFNDQQTLRTYRSKTDAYAVFEQMLHSGNPPDDFAALKKQAHLPSF